MVVAALLTATACNGSHSLPADPVPTATLTWFDRKGTPGTSVPNSAAAYQDLWLARDEQSVVAAIVDAGRATLWRIDLLTGRRVAVPIDIPSNIGGHARRITTWMPEVVIYDVTGGNGRTEIWADPADADAAAYLADNEHQRAGRLSGERRWMAYESLETGVSEIYLRTFPDPNNARWLLAFGNARRPVWRSDSHEIYHWAGDGMLTATSLKRGDKLILPVRSTPLFSLPKGDAPPYVVTRDSRLLIAATAR